MASTAPYWGTDSTVSHQMQRVSPSFPSLTRYSSDSVSATGAFTSVAARRNFGHNKASATPSSSITPISQPAPSQPTTAARTKRDWPESVRLYVQRAFAAENSVPGVDREEMEMKLKQVISDSAESNTLTIIDWANMPLPQHMILDERQRSGLIPPGPAWGNVITPLGLHETNMKSNESPSKKRKSSDLESSQKSQEKILHGVLLTIAMYSKIESLTLINGSGTM